MSTEHDKLVEELIKLLHGGGAHDTFKQSIDNLPADMRGVKPDGMPYSIWQLVEHIRIAQWDMVQFCIDADHQSPKWPDEYWPKESSPKDADTWDKAIKQINADLGEFIGVLKKEDIYKKLPHGSGQSILREALQIADHNSYHIAEIVALRRMLNVWN